MGRGGLARNPPAPRPFPGAPHRCSCAAASTAQASCAWIAALSSSSPPLSRSGTLGRPCLRGQTGALPSVVPTHWSCLRQRSLQCRCRLLSLQPNQPRSRPRHARFGCSQASAMRCRSQSKPAASDFPGLPDPDCAGIRLLGRPAYSRSADQPLVRESSGRVILPGFPLIASGSPRPLAQTARSGKPWSVLTCRAATAASRCSCSIVLLVSMCAIRALLAFAGASAGCRTVSRIAWIFEEPRQRQADQHHSCHNCGGLPAAPIADQRRDFFEGGGAQAG